MQSWLAFSLEPGADPEYVYARMSERLEKLVGLRTCEIIVEEDVPYLEDGDPGFTIVYLEPQGRLTPEIQEELEDELLVLAENPGVEGVDGYLEGAGALAV